MSRVSRITDEIQKIDRDLYAAWFHDKICIFRKSLRYEFYDCDGETIVFGKPDKHFIWALTDDWKLSGRPVEWGVEPLMARLRQHDMWNNERFMDDLMNGYEKDAKSVDRDVDNKIESFLYDARDKFKHDFKDVNTANLKKIDKRRIKDGNR